MTKTDGKSLDFLVSNQLSGKVCFFAAYPVNESLTISYETGPMVKYIQFSESAEVSKYNLHLHLVYQTSLTPTRYQRVRGYF